MLPRPVGLSREEAAIYCTWFLGTALISFGRGGNDIVAHLLPKHPRLPAKRVPVELRHALAVVVGHLALSGHRFRLCECPLLGVKRKSPVRPTMSAYDPKRTSWRRVDPQCSPLYCRGLRRSRLHIASWHAGEKETEPLGHGRVGKNGVA